MMMPEINKALKAIQDSYLRLEQSERLTTQASNDLGRVKDLVQRSLALQAEARRTIDSMKKAQT